ncbi:MAG: hypothetical protein HY226_00455, partial [Candidatus Vogelbacteria bacterium]|nr:hypothetical protein [Candidatus Vogelbacteria bacterium]
GSYTDLSNKPTIFDGKFSSLTGVPTTLSGFGITDAQITSGKDTSDGYVGLTLFKINFKNNANTSTSFFTNANTTARTYTFPDKNGTVAMTSDITGTNSGVNTGDQTITLTGDVTGSGTGSFAVTIANGSVTEAKQTLADNTTNNVSTINHGYAPKAPNDTTKFFRGDGTWATLPAAAVTSVFGRTSAVTAQSNDYTWAQIDKTTSSLADFTTRAITDLTGTLGVNHGGTGATTLTSNGILFGNGTSALGVTVAGTNGQLLLGVTSGAPAFGTLSGDATITNAGALTIAASAITNAKVSATAAIAYSKLNLTGAILNTDLAGSITASKLVGTDITTLGTITTGTWNGTAIAVANGGTGQTTYTNGQILIGNTTLGTLAKTNLTPGSGIDVTNGAGTITIANGAPAMISGGTGANDIPASLTSFAPFGFMAPQTSDASGTTRTVVTRSGTIKNLFVVQSAVSGNSKTISYTVTKNGVSQTLTASVTGNSVATANDTTHSFTVAAGDEIGITMVAGAVGAGNRANWSVDFVN